MLFARSRSPGHCARTRFTDRSISGPPTSRLGSLARRASGRFADGWFSPPARRAAARRRAGTLHSCTVAVLAGCAAAPIEPATAGELAPELERELSARADSARELLRSGNATDLVGALLETSAPAVLAARREAAIAAAKARAAGAPVSMLDVEHVGAGSDRETEAMLALDLPGLVGAGRAGAARARAEAESLRASAAPDAAVFRTRHELERALATLAVARRLEEDLAALEAVCEPNARRLDLLERRGWLAPDQVAAARAMLHHVSATREQQAAAVAAARARVAAEAGLAPDSPWLDDPELCGEAAVEARARRRESQSDPGSRELLERHPALRLRRYEYLVAETEVRVASAQRWPALLLGPKATFTQDDVLFGGMLRLELPWPPAAGAAVEAARAQREAARDRLVAALAEARNAVARRRVEQAAAERALREHGGAVLAASEQALRAAQARFSIDAGALPEWSMAVDQRARALATAAGASERWLVATFDLSEARGGEGPR